MKIQKNPDEYKSYVATVKLPFGKEQHFVIDWYGHGWEVYPICLACETGNAPIFKDRYLKECKRFIQLVEENLNALL